MQPLRLSLLTALALAAFAGNSLLCRAALGPGHIDAASFTAVRLAAGALMLALLVGAVQVTMVGDGLARGRVLSASQVLGLSLALLGLLVLLLPGWAAPPPMAAALMIAAGIAWGVYSLRG